MKKIYIITLFPDYFKAFGTQGKAASAFGKDLSLEILDLRDYSGNKYRSVDDYPYGGGEGMVIKADVLKRSIEALGDNLRVIFPGPRGKVWNHKIAQDMAKDIQTQEKNLVFICGRYEGLDERFIQKYVDEQYSLGDFILTGGELAAMAMIDSMVRFIPGTLGNEEGAIKESFQNGLLEHPQYTRPRNFEGMQVPEVLLSGNHKLIEEHKTLESLKLTRLYRPDLLEN